MPQAVEGDAVEAVFTGEVLPGPRERWWLERLAEPRADTRKRQDPLDPATFRHAPECEHRDVIDPAIVRAILTVTDRENYWAVTCGTCDTIWQVAYFAAGSVE